LTVRHIGVPVAVVVLVDTVGLAVRVCVRESFVSRCIAVVINPVTELYRDGADLGVDGGAIQGVRRPVAIVIVVTVIVEAIAVRIDGGGVVVSWTAVERVEEAIAIVVVVADVAFAVSIEVLLIGVGDQRAVVDLIGHPVVVVISVHAVGAAIVVGVREHLVDVPVAVVVDPVTGLVAWLKCIADEPDLPVT
jgi:hypothetical protein